MTKNYLVQKVSDAEVEKPCFGTESLIFGGITATFTSPSINAHVHTWRPRTDHRRAREPTSVHVLVGGGQLLESSRTFFKCQGLCTSPFYQSFGSPPGPGQCTPCSYVMFVVNSVMSDSLWPAKCSMPGFLSFTISLSLLKLMSIESVVPSNCLILCHPLLLCEYSQFMEEFHVQYLIHHFSCFQVKLVQRSDGICPWSPTQQASADDSCWRTVKVVLTCLWR